MDRTRVLETWTFEGYEVLKVKGWWQKVDEEPQYQFRLHGSNNINMEAFYTLDRCIVEAIAAKYVGSRGASGTAVDTAGGWFARMIGMEDKPRES